MHVGYTLEYVINIHLISVTVVAYILSYKHIYICTAIFSIIVMFVKLLCILFIL